MSQTKLKPKPSPPPISRPARGAAPRPGGAVQSDRPKRPTVLGPVDTVVENGTMNAGSWRERIRSGENSCSRGRVSSGGWPGMMNSGRGGRSGGGALISTCPWASAGTGPPNGMVRPSSRSTTQASLLIYLGYHRRGRRAIRQGRTEPGGTGGPQGEAAQGGGGRGGGGALRARRGALGARDGGGGQPPAGVSALESA